MSDPSEGAAGQETAADGAIAALRLAELQAELDRLEQAGAHVANPLQDAERLIATGCAGLELAGRSLRDRLLTAVSGLRAGLDDEDLRRGGQALATLGLTALAGKLRNSSPESMIEDLRGVAARHPALFVLGTAVAGYALVRVLQSGETAATDQDPAALPPEDLA